MFKQANKVRLHKKLTEIIFSNLYQQTEYTKSEIQKNIENYGVFVNGFKVFNRLHWSLKEDKIDFSHWPVRSKGNFAQIETVADEKDFLIIFKPKNLVVQPGAGHLKDNLITWLEENFSEQKKIDSITRGLVHRLDKDTQGLLLIAKSQDSLEFFQNQFRDRQVEKKYLALVQGRVDKVLEIKGWQARAKKNPISQKFFQTELEAKNYDVKARYNHSVFYPKVFCPELNLGLVEVEIKTGRMHQIRLHAQQLGFNLFQDKIYFQKNQQKFKPETVLKQPLTKPILKISKQDFMNLYKKIFKTDVLGYSLLSNQLGFKTLDNQNYFIRLFEV